MRTPAGGRHRLPGGGWRRYEDAGFGVGSLAGVGPVEPLPDRLPAELVSVGVADGLELSVGEPDPVGLGEEVSVVVGVGDVGVADGDVVVGVADGDPESESDGVAVADGLALGFRLEVLDGLADGQGVAVVE